MTATTSKSSIREGRVYIHMYILYIYVIDIMHLFDSGMYYVLLK